MNRRRIVTFGELLLRFSKPGQLRLTQGDMFTSKYGGSEANVAVSLATQGEQVTYITRRDRYTLALGLNIFRGSFNDDWSSIMCATCLSFIPGIVFYLIGQKYFVEGIVLTGMKD